MTGYGNGPGRTPTNPTEYYWLGAGATERLHVGDSDFTEQFTFPREQGLAQNYDWAMLVFKGPQANERYHGADFGDVFGGGGVNSYVDFFPANSAARRASDLTDKYCVANWPQGVYDIRMRMEWGLNSSNHVEHMTLFMLEAHMAGEDDVLVASSPPGRTTFVSPAWDFGGGFPVSDLIVSDLEVAAPGGDVGGYYFALAGSQGVPSSLNWRLGTNVASLRGYLRAERKD